MFWSLFLVLGFTLQVQSKEIVDLALGSNHTCVLYEDEFRCFGRAQAATRNQLAGFSGATSIDTERARCISDRSGLWCSGPENQLLSSYVSNPEFFATGNNFSCASQQDEISCFGSAGAAKTPKKLNGVRDLIAFSGVGCAIWDQGIECWGISHGTRDLIPKDRKDFVKLFASAKPSTVCGITTSKKLECWSTEIDSDLFLTPPADLADVTDVGIGKSHICAIATGNVRCWGRNDVGQLNVPELKNPRLIDSGYKHTCAVDDRGLHCWGTNYWGESEPPKDIVNPKAIVSGSGYSCAIADEKYPQCWGQVEQRILSARVENAVYGSAGSSVGICFVFGPDRKVSCDGVNDVPENLGNVEQLATGGSHACALADNTVTCWGNNGYGQAHARGDIVEPIAVSAGYRHSCVLDKLGAVCWGSNENRALESPRILNDPKEIASFTSHSCLIDGSEVKCWGDNRFGQATPPSNLVAPHSIQVGFRHSCVIDQGKVICWGDNAEGQTNVPDGISNPRLLSAGGEHSCVWHDDGMECWGLNSYGQLEFPTALP